MSKSDRRALACALIGALVLTGCGPRPSVEIRVMPTPTPQAVIERAAEPAGETYVLNRASQRFHLPGCAWAERISDANRIDYAGDRETLIEVGYEPCHYCKP